jgi:protein gp37
MIFVNSMSDLFHEKVPFNFIYDVYSIMSMCEKHTFQILTKRPERALRFYAWVKEQGFQSIENLKNVWLGVSCENQETADERIPILLQIPAAVRWVSAEPLLEKIQLAGRGYLRNLDWIVIGVESGRKRRHTKIEDVGNLIFQCKEMQHVYPGLKIFVKQIEINNKVVKDINEFPSHLQVRQYPKEAK